MRQPTNIAHYSVMLDRAFSFVAVLGAFGTAAAWLLGHQGFGQQALVSASMLVLLGGGLIGMWALPRTQEYICGEVSRAFSMARRGERPPSPQQEATPIESLGFALQSMAEVLWRSTTKPQGLARWSVDINRTLTAKRREADLLSTTLGEDARVIGAATTSGKLAERELMQRLEASRGHAAEAARATDAVASDAAQLTDAIRAVTARTEQGTAITTQLAERVFAAQRSVAGLSDTAAALERMADSVGGDAQGVMLAAVQELKAQTGQAVHWVQEVSEAVQAQHEMGHALSHAAMLQADAVGRILSRLGAAQTEVGALRSQIDGYSRRDDILGVGMAAQQAVERLPSYAEAMAQILRGLPDFNSDNDAAWRDTASPAEDVER